MAMIKNFWLFSVMIDDCPDSWESMVKMGIAAQHYPYGWVNEKRNVNKLDQLKKGDQIVAAFGKHQFAGYGTLTSDFYRGGQSLNIYFEHLDVYAEFAERFDVEWSVFPFDGDGDCIECHELKEEGFSIDLLKGFCVRQIDKASFNAIKNMLDDYGVVKFIPDDTTSISEAATPESATTSAQTYPVGQQLDNQSEFADCLEDLEEHFNEYMELDKTEQRSIIKSRIGQGIYRERLIELWGSCSVTGVKNLAVLRASHIKPWAVSSNNERLDPYNGLLLIPNLDVLFDCGLITFDDCGMIIISPRMSLEEISTLNIGMNLCLRHVHKKNEPYLEYHRDNIFI